MAAALADVSAEDEEEAARRLVRKRLTASGGLDREVLQRRLLAMLARKGHPPGSALRVIRDELERAGLTRDGASRAGRRAGRDVDGDLQVDRDPGDGDLGDGDLGDGDLGDGDAGLD